MEAGHQHSVPMSLGLEPRMRLVQVVAGGLRSRVGSCIAHSLHSL